MVEDKKGLCLHVPRFQNKQVLREDNTKFDALANLDSAFKIHPDTKIPISYNVKPAIEDIKEEMVHNPTISELNILEQKILNLESSTKSWILRILQYLKDRSIPKSEKVPRTFKLKSSQFNIIHHILFKNFTSGPYLRYLED